MHWRCLCNTGGGPLPALDGIGDCDRVEWSPFGTPQNTLPPAVLYAGDTDTWRVPDIPFGQRQNIWLSNGLRVPVA